MTTRTRHALVVLRVPITEIDPQVQEDWLGEVPEEPTTLENTLVSEVESLFRPGVDMSHVTEGSGVFLAVGHAALVSFAMLPSDDEEFVILPPCRTEDGADEEGDE